LSVDGIVNEMILQDLKIYNNEYEDTLQYLSAKINDCDFIIINYNSFYTYNIETYSSIEFAKSLKTRVKVLL